ncbi:MAG: hypothetical protein JO266_21335 [Acidobacteria bacterium]|nr:hypothetical protein [Acidobacteriota bacterium]
MPIVAKLAHDAFQKYLPQKSTKNTLEGGIVSRSCTDKVILSCCGRATFAKRNVRSNGGPALPRRCQGVVWNLETKKKVGVLRKTPGGRRGLNSFDIIPHWQRDLKIFATGLPPS